MKSLLQEVLDEVEAYLEAHQMHPTRFGLEATKNPNLVFRLRKGRSPTTKTIDRIREYMEGNR